MLSIAILGTAVPSKKVFKKVIDEMVGRKKPKNVTFFVLNDQLGKLVSSYAGRYGFELVTKKVNREGRMRFAQEYSARWCLLNCDEAVFFGQTEQSLENLTILADETPVPFKKVVGDKIIND